MNRPGSIGSLALALGTGRGPERLFVIITTFIDESGTHGGPVHLMGCLVGNVKHWESFDLEWRQHLADNGLTYYHSKKLKHTQGEFKGWKRDQKRRFLTKAAQLTEQHTMLGVTAVMGYSDYNKYYVANERPPEVQLDSKYGLLFRFCLLRIIDLLRYRLGDPDDLDLYFVLESGHVNFGDALRIFNRLKERGPSDIRRVLKTLIPGDKKDYPGLQGADSGAHHGLDNELGRSKPPGIIRIPAPSKKVIAGPQPWQHHNFIISPEKLIEFKAEIMKEAEAKRARRQPR